MSTTTTPPPLPKQYCLFDGRYHRSVYRCKEDNDGLFLCPESACDPFLPSMHFVYSNPPGEQCCSVEVRLGSLYRLYVDLGLPGTLILGESAGEGIHWLLVSRKYCELVPDRKSLPLYYSLRHTRPGWVDTILYLRCVPRQHVDGNGGTSCHFYTSTCPVIGENLLLAEIRARSQFGDGPTTLLLREQQEEMTLLFEERDSAEEPAAVENKDKQGWVLASRHYYRFVREKEESPPVSAAAAPKKMYCRFSSQHHRVVYRCMENNEGLFLQYEDDMNAPPSPPPLTFTNAPAMEANTCAITLHLGRRYRLHVDFAFGKGDLNESPGEGIHWLCIPRLCCELTPYRESLPLYYTLLDPGTGIVPPEWLDRPTACRWSIDDHVDGLGQKSGRICRLNDAPLSGHHLLRSEVRARSRLGTEAYLIDRQRVSTEYDFTISFHDKARETVTYASPTYLILRAGEYYRFMDFAEPVPTPPPVFTASVWQQRLDEAMQHVDKTVVVPLFDRIMKQCEQEVTVDWLIRQASADAGTLEGSRSWYYRQEKADWTDEIQERLKQYGKERGFHLRRVGGKLFVELPKRDAEEVLPPMTWKEHKWRRRLRARDMRVIIDGVPYEPPTPAEEKLFRQRLRQEARVVNVAAVPEETPLVFKKEGDETSLTTEEMHRRRQLRSRDNGPILVGLSDPAEQTTMTCEGSKLQPLLHTSDRIILTPQLPVISINNAVVEAMPLWQFQRRALAMHCHDSLRYTERARQVYQQLLQQVTAALTEKESRYFQEAPGKPLSSGILKDLADARILCFHHVWDPELDIYAVRKRVVGLAYCDGFNATYDDLEKGKGIKFLFTNV